MSSWREGESGVEEWRKWGFRGLRSAILEAKTKIYQYDVIYNLRRYSNGRPRRERI